MRKDEKIEVLSRWMNKQENRWKMKLQDASNMMPTDPYFHLRLCQDQQIARTVMEILEDLRKSIEVDGYFIEETGSDLSEGR